MAYDTNNIFAKILRGEIPCIKVYEDAHTLAFMDIMPQVDGHTLVIPKESATTLFELSDEAAAACMATVRTRPSPRCCCTSRTTSIGVGTLKPSLVTRSA